MAFGVVATKLTHRAGPAHSGYHWAAGEAILPQYTASGNTGTVHWSDGGAGGSFSAATGLVVTYTPGNESKPVVITADDDLASVETALTVDATFPIHPQRGYKPTWIGRGTSVEAPGGEEWFESKGLPYMTWECEYTGTDKTELQAVVNFWLYHQKDTYFYFQDVELGILSKCRLDSDIPAAVVLCQSYDFSLVFKALAVYAPA